MSDMPAVAAPIPPSPTTAPRRRMASLRMVWHFARQYPVRIVIFLVSLILSTSATLSVPLGFRLIVDQGFGARSGQDIHLYFYAFYGIVIALGLSTAVRFYFVSWIGERTIADIRAAVQRNLLRQPPAYFEENRPSEIASRMTADTAIIEQVVGTTVSVALRNLGTGIGGSIILFILAPKLTGIMLVGIPVIVMPIVLLGRRLSAMSRNSQDRIADVGSMATEVLGAMKIVQGFGQEPREASRFADVVERTFAVAKRRIALRAVMTSMVILLLFGAMVSLLWYGANEVVAGRITGGTIASFVLTGGLVAGAFGSLTEVWSDFIRAAGAASRLEELLNAEPDIAPPAKPAMLPQPPTGSLTFENVSFRYPTRPDASALSDFNLVIAPNETIAIVGPSGAGKTTLFQLAQRFYDPQAGRVLIDGVDLRDADPADVRARIAMVPQETVIFAASARDNLRYGRWDASDAEIWAAAKAANAAEFIRALPQGLDTFLGEAGTRLSGGQRQRVAIARALIRNAPLLLLDEATSALDAESERLVQDAIDRMMDERTTIVIAHRLATVRAADRIIVMDQGRIVEQGTHDALVAQGGLYARLASLQFDMIPAFTT